MNDFRETLRPLVVAGGVKIQMAPTSPKTRDSGPKACTGCHTTRTPQWREGPSGPKTLCNACGVRRVRRNKGRGPQSETTSVATRASPSPETWTGGDSGGDEQAFEPLSRQYDTAKTNEPSPLGRRPLRKAAVKAASRTAEFATTGDWPYHQASSLLSADGRVLQSAPASPVAASSDISLGGSDSAEEVAWVPQHPAAEGPMEVKSNSRQDTSAAIDLLILNYKDSSSTAWSSTGADTTSAMPPLFTGSSVAQHLSTIETPPNADYAPINTGAVAASSRPLARFTFLRANSALSPAELAAERLLRTSFPERFAQYEALQSYAEASWRQSAASEAAIAAVAEFLAQKQTAAIKARHTARAVTQHLHAFLKQASADLFPAAAPAVKRQRNSY